MCHDREFAFRGLRSIFHFLFGVVCGVPEISKRRRVRPIVPAGAASHPTHTIINMLVPPAPPRPADRARPVERCTHVERSWDEDMRALGVSHPVSRDACTHNILNNHNTTFALFPWPRTYSPSPTRTPLFVLFVVLLLFPMLFPLRVIYNYETHIWKAAH